MGSVQTHRSTARSWNRADHVVSGPLRAPRWLIRARTETFEALRVLAVRVPWLAIQVDSDKRTPSSISLRAVKHRAPYSPIVGLSNPYSSRVAAVSFDKSISRGNDVCMRAAVSNSRSGPSIPNSQDSAAHAVDSAFPNTAMLASRLLAHPIGRLQVEHRRLARSKDRTLKTAGNHPELQFFSPSIGKPPGSERAPRTQASLGSRNRAR